MEYQYNIAGHLCRIVFCDAGNDSSLLPSFSPFESEEEGNLLFCLSVDDAFRWPVTGEEVGQFDCGGNNFGVYRLPDGSYQFEICDEKKALCCYLQANLESFASLLPSVSTMKWDRRIHSAHCDTISDIIRLSPIYLLGCRPDEEAARLSFHTLTGR